MRTDLNLGLLLGALLLLGACGASNGGAGGGSGGGTAGGSGGGSAGGSGGGSAGGSGGGTAGGSGGGTAGGSGGGIAGGTGGGFTGPIDCATTQQLGNQKSGATFVLDMGGNYPARLSPTNVTVGDTVVGRFTTGPANGGAGHIGAAEWGSIASNRYGTLSQQPCDFRFPPPPTIAG